MRKTLITASGLLSIIAVAFCSLILQLSPAMAQATPSAQSQSEGTTGEVATSAPLLDEDDPFDQPGSSQEAIASSARIKLTALLTDRGPPISNGITWHIFKPDASGGTPMLVKQLKTATPDFEIQPGVYLINAAFGLAYLTRTVNLEAGNSLQEKFVINAGGLRITVKPSSENLQGLVNAKFDLLDSERDQFGNRRLLLSGVQPGLITRLNAGIYRIVSRLGDANAIVSSEVTVEAGKLTEATVLHEAAKVTFKLVQRSGGDALAGAQWTIMTGSGRIVKETAGALPTHILAPGDYTISARLSGRLYTRTFTIKSGDNVEVEVVIQ